MLLLTKVVFLIEAIEEKNCKQITKAMCIIKYA